MNCILRKLDSYPLHASHTRILGILRILPGNKSPPQGITNVRRLRLREPYEVVVVVAHSLSRQRISLTVEIAMRLDVVRSCVLRKGASHLKNVRSSGEGSYSSFSFLIWSFTDLKNSELSIRPASECTASRSILSLVLVTFLLLKTSNAAISSAPIIAAMRPK